MTTRMDNYYFLVFLLSANPNLFGLSHQSLWNMLQKLEIIWESDRSFDHLVAEVGMTAAVTTLPLDGRDQKVLHISIDMI